MFTFPIVDSGFETFGILCGFMCGCVCGCGLVCSYLWLSVAFFVVRSFNFGFVVLASSNPTLASVLGFTISAFYLFDL
jgi:accessory gene regulator protein AgrB